MSKGLVKRASRILSPDSFREIDRVERPCPSIITATVWAYWDLYYIVRTYWQASLVSVALLSIGSVAIWIGPIYLTTSPAVQTIARIALLIALSFLLSSFLLRVHLALLLGDAAADEDVGWSSERFQAYFGRLSIFVLLLAFPSCLAILTAPTGPTYYVGSRPPMQAASILAPIATFAMWLVVCRLLVLLPAAAIGAPGATWQNALRDMGRAAGFGRSVIVLPLLPVVMLAAAPLSWFKQLPGSATAMIAASLWLGIVLFIATTLVAAVATRLYQFVGDQLNSPRSS
ncbi:hypothetical protein [Rhodopseudomonas sp. B29]|uniref:hypothetical protein n=1 Tax=Rhodopseudomonas sp. B29 TaxID=95607 RepID=UPI0011D28A61|nr:hypothetical protein [Rhodopseudomonas sp. B29]